VGPFYPKGTGQAAFLASYARHFWSVEVNGTFYRLPSAETLRTWREETPKDFIFACKAHRYITHRKKLKDPQTTLDGFFEAIGELREKLGPILFQLPPHWHINVERLRKFLAALPDGYRYVFEFRDKSWFAPAVYDILSAKNAALCCYDLAGETSPLAVTADFIYLRLHGPGGPYQGSYDDQTLARWVRRLTAWGKSGLDGYCYFDNDEQGFAPRNARRLLELLSAD
jgi:uncharacterized protein YecE (DUF72 family)